MQVFSVYFSVCACPRTVERFFWGGVGVVHDQCPKTDTEFLNWKIIQSQAKQSLEISKPKHNQNQRACVMDWN